jgi:hypothetical protein
MVSQTNKKRTPQVSPSTLDKFVNDICESLSGTQAEHSNGYLHGFMNRVEAIEAKRQETETEMEQKGSSKED